MDDNPLTGSGRRAPGHADDIGSLASSLTAEEAINEATFRRFHDAVNTGDLDRISAIVDEVFDPDVVIGTPLPIDAAGAEALKQVWAMLLRAYPDLHVTIEDLIAGQDKLVVRNSVTGTNLGEYLGRPPTGKSVRYDEVFVLRFADGRITETWGIVDVLAQMKQLGLLAA